MFREFIKIIFLPIYWKEKFGLNSLKLDKKKELNYIRFINFLPVIITITWLLVLMFFDKSMPGFQFNYNYVNKNLAISFGLDGFSLLFILLTTIVIFPLCFIASKTIKVYYKYFHLCLLSMEILLILTFYSTNLLCFYICFESILIPMFLVIGVWGSRSRKIKAAYYFFLYTLFGSLFMLFGIYYLYTITGNLDYTVILNTKFNYEQQILLWITFFMAFAVKIPMFPFHLWLPEAHVEAPTIGSVILASLLLKLGGYGFVRFTIPMFPEATQFFRPLIFTLCIVSILYASLTAIRQIDLKKIIAYSSIAHMNLIVLGLHSHNLLGIDGAIYLMIAHGITSSALFFCVGILYDRYHTRILMYYGGVAQVMPIFSTFFLIFTLANMGFPGTCNFVGELALLYGLLQQNTIVAFFSATGIILSAIYSIWLYNRIFFGTLKIKYNKNYIDLTKLEFHILLILLILTFVLGNNSNLILDILIGSGKHTY